MPISLAFYLSENIIVWVKLWDQKTWITEGLINWKCPQIQVDSIGLVISVNNCRQGWEKKGIQSMLLVSILYRREHSTRYKSNWVILESLIVVSFLLKNWKQQVQNHWNEIVYKPVKCTYLLWQRYLQITIPILRRRCFICENI